MTANSRAKLKLCGQKLFNIDTQGGNLSTLGGLLPVARLAEDTGLIQEAARLIPDWRKKAATKFPIDLQLAQRVLLAASGHPDAIDCSFFKDDPALKVIFGESLGGESLPSQSTATRLEQRISKETMAQLESLPVRYFIQKHVHKPRALTIYVDGTAIRTFGSQEKSTWRGGYGQTQYFPLLATTSSGELLLAQLREGSQHDSRSAESIIQLVQDLKKAWKDVKITIVMDTGFNSPGLLEQLDSLNVWYVIGYPTMSSLKSKIKDVMQAAEKQFRKQFGEPLYTGKSKNKHWQKEHDRIRSLPTKERTDAERKALARHVRIIYCIKHNNSKWSTERDVVVRVDYTDKGLDVRSVVTNMESSTADRIYEDHYCKRSRIEMFIKEAKSHCKVPLSCQTFTANQFRFTTIQGLAYMILHELRQQLPSSQNQIALSTVRNRFLLIPVLIEETERRVVWHLSSVHQNSRSIMTVCKKLQSRTA